MRIQFIRYATNAHATASMVFIDGVFFCHGLEDQKQEVKIPGETRIPAGVYRVKYRTELTPMTERYRARYPWFKYHLWLQDVPDFTFCYVHIGNDDDDTDGCPLVGESINNLKVARGWLGGSTAAYKRFYETVGEAFARGEDCFIELRDTVL